MIEESSFVGNHPLRWLPNLQFSNCIRTKAAVCTHGVHNASGFQEELKLQSTGEIGNGEFKMEKNRTIQNGGLGLERRENIKTVQNFIRRKQDGYCEPEEIAACALVAALKTCAKEKDLQKGRSTHNELIRRGLLRGNVYAGSTLINMYAKCGVLDTAQQVFDELSVKNEVTWNALIAGYVQHGHGEKALHCFEQMRHEGFFPTAVTYISTLKACSSVGAIDKGQDIHAQILREHLLEEHVEVANALVDMYTKCGELQSAKEVFDELPIISVISWTALITGYAQYGYCREALGSFEQMQMCGLPADAVTVTCVLQACGGVGALDKGQGLHAWILRECLLGEDVIMANALIDMYIKCGAIRSAQRVFDELPMPDMISWNTLIDGYAHEGHGREAFACIHCMRSGGFSPDAATFACILKACASAKALDTGQKLHACVITEPFFVADIALGNAIVDMYAKCGALEEAQDVFDELPTRDVVSWNTLLSGYDQHNLYEEAMGYFEQMRVEGFSPDVFTFTCIFRVCGGLGAACKGQQLHAEIVKHGSFEKVMVVGIALIVMYTSCGMLMEAQYLFDKLPVQDVVSWSALLEGFTQLGKYENVFHSFDIMVREGLKPNSVTFLVLLNACSHGGLVDKCQIFFEYMRRFDIVPAVEHYACMVDLFCRAGRLDEAVALIEEMHYSADGAVWRMLLSASREGGNRKVGAWAFEGAVHGNWMDAALFICLSNMYSAASRQENASSMYE